MDGCVHEDTVVAVSFVWMAFHVVVSFSAFIGMLLYAQRGWG